MEDEHRRLIRIKPNLECRALINQFTRTFFIERDFLEVETPIRVPGVAPELYIIPFESEDWFLSTSPELYMKRLLAAGYDRLFQISHCFRKGEQGRHHNPEFTMLEWYRNGADYKQMIRDTEELVLTIAKKLDNSSIIHYRDREIDLTPPWQRVTVRDAFLQAAGWDPVTQPEPLRFDTDLVTKVVTSFPPGRPIVLQDYPAGLASLDRLSPHEPKVAERAEVFIGGLELANAYSELNDSDEQRKRFREEIEEIEREQGRKISLPERFLEAVARLPQCGGIALGIDRLVMLFSNTDRIDDVTAFTADTA
jgi:lysyl-tRNA synthetase class 2